MDYLLGSSVDAARWYWLVDKLSEAAKRRALLNVEIDQTTLVNSDTIRVLLNHYAQAIPGKTVLMWLPVCSAGQVHMTVGRSKIFQKHEKHCSAYECEYLCGTAIEVKQFSELCSNAMVL